MVLYSPLVGGVDLALLPGGVDGGLKSPDIHGSSRLQGCRCDVAVSQPTRCRWHSRCDRRFCPAGPSRRRSATSTVVMPSAAAGRRLRGMSSTMAAFAGNDAVLAISLQSSRDRRLRQVLGGDDVEDVLEMVADAEPVHDCSRMGDRAVGVDQLRAPAARASAGSSSGLGTPARHRSGGRNPGMRRDRCRD